MREEFQAEHKKHIGVVDMLLRFEIDENLRLTMKVPDLEKEVAEMRGELRRLMRDDRRDDNVVEIPRSGWKSNAA